MASQSGGEVSSSLAQPQKQFRSSNDEREESYRGQQIEPHSARRTSVKGGYPKSILKQSTCSDCRNDHTSTNALNEAINVRSDIYDEYPQNLPYNINTNSSSDINSSPNISEYERIRSTFNVSDYNINDVPFEMLSEQEKLQIMHENLRKQRQRPVTMHNQYPKTSFSGPFFRLEQTEPVCRQRSQSVAPLLTVKEPSDDNHLHSSRKQSSSKFDIHIRNSHPDFYYSSQPSIDRQRFNNSTQTSISDLELQQNQHFNNERYTEGYRDDRANVVYWPPPQSSQHTRPPSTFTKNITDPERINEYRRQKQLELEALQRRNEQNMIYRQKQSHSVETQHKHDFERPQSNMPLKDDTGLMSSIRDLSSPNERIHLRNLNFSPSERDVQIDDSQEAELANLNAQQVYVFETKPISPSLSNENQSLTTHDSLYSPTVGTWKRTYVVDSMEPNAKNEIINSNELLERERFDVDLLKCIININTSSFPVTD
ncbi:unnamed protein product [Anisakis simplex]|uniref:SH2 domain-containing protein n=1 Tax=Anisakis simplex TaxID=6269 RepID=A0A0M3K9S7_ANISI|nr:unnamed protein product [Anisakis simplex]